MPYQRDYDALSRKRHLHKWAVVLVSHDERNCWFSHFFEKEQDARKHMRESKAPLHKYSLRLYRLDDERSEGCL